MGVLIKYALFIIGPGPAGFLLFLLLPLLLLLSLSAVYPQP